MSTQAGVSARAVEALREELAALRAENTTLREELTTKAEAAGLWQGRARTLEAQLLQLSAPTEQPQAAPEAQGAPEGLTPDNPGGAPAAGLWARVRRVFGGGGGVAPMLRPIARVYAPLAEHLAARAAAGEWRVTLTFAQVEARIGRPLPAPARESRRHRRWWRGQANAPHAWYGWQRVGWRMEAVDLAAETVTFARPGDGG